MRIRKTVAKLLGSALVYPSPLSLSDAWAPSQSSNLLEGSDSAIGGSTEVCLLNQSPWDASPNPDLFLRSCEDLESASSSKEEKRDVAAVVISENNEGILGRASEKQEIKNKPLQVCKNKCEKKKTTKKTDANEIKKTKKKEKEKGVIELCKKNDGRKWFCKRPAQLPHKFCEYHASQSRSYYTGAAIDKPKKKKQKQKKEKDKQHHNDTTSSFYYYYDGFGPWRGKLRGDSKNGDDKREEEQEEDEHVQKEEDLMEDCDLTMAGGNGDGEEEDDNKEIVSSSKGTGEKKVGKKRGRKPVKCRSLKSLL